MKKFLIGFIAVILVLFIIGIIVPGDKNYENQKKEQLEQKESEDLSSMAFMQSQEFVKNELNFPEIASFDYKYVEQNTNNDYTIGGFVNSTNAYGVPIKREYKCVLHYKGGAKEDTENWELKYPILFE